MPQNKSACFLKNEYEPEQKRWIAQRVEGKFKDWFSRISEIEAEK